MKDLRPSPEYERRELLRTRLRSRAGIAPGAIPFLFGDDAWRESNPGTRQAFFILTLAAAGAFFGFLQLLFSSKAALVGGGLLALAGELADGVLRTPQGETGEHEYGHDRYGDEPGDEPHGERTAHEVTTVSGHDRGPVGSRHL